jgi:hypothetical protein
MFVDVAFVVVPFTTERFEIDDEALFTLSAPVTSRAVVDANVKALLVEERVTTWRLLIEEEALFTLRAPVTSRAVVDEKDTRSFVTLRFVIVDEALLTMSAPETERAVVDAYGN